MVPIFGKKVNNPLVEKYKIDTIVGRLNSLERKKEKKFKNHLTLNNWYFYFKILNELLFFY